MPPPALQCSFPREIKFPVLTQGMVERKTSFSVSSWKSRMFPACQEGGRRGVVRLPKPALIHVYRNAMNSCVCTPNVQDRAVHLPGPLSQVLNCTAHSYEITSCLQSILMTLEPIRTLHDIVVTAFVPSAQRLSQAP